jgi:hypothetical protein
LHDFFGSFGSTETKADDWLFGVTNADKEIDETASKMALSLCF